MLLDLRILLAASFAAVVLLIGGVGLVAALRTPGKPSIEISAGSAEITGAIGSRGEKSHSLTEADKIAQPAQSPAAASPEPMRAVNVDTAEKAVPPAAEEDKPEKSKRAAIKPKPRIRAVAARQETGANFRANNPLSFPFFGAGANPGQ
jgi:hypothetical protein